MNLELSSVKLRDLVRRLRAGLTFTGLLTAAAWGLIAILMLLLFVDALMFSRYALAPGAPRPEVGAGVPSVSGDEILRSREILSQRRQALGARLAAPVTLPNPFR